MSADRLPHIASLIHVELSKILQLEIEDPRLRFVTITGVTVSRDLSIAKIYIVSRDEKNAAQLLKLLKKGARFLRYRLAHRLILRRMPELQFYYDLSLKKGEHIDQLLRSVTDTVVQDDEK